MKALFKIFVIFVFALMCTELLHAENISTSDIEEIVISLKELYYYKLKNEFIRNFENKGLFSIFDYENLVIYARVGKFLKINVINYDPDRDNVTVIFSKPFSKDGTFYVSKEGNYYGKIILFDGKDYTEVDVKIIAIDINKFPTVICKEIQIFQEGEKAKLDCSFFPEGGKLKISGFFNTLEKEIQYNESGEYYTKVTYCTSVCVEKEIKIIVKDVNRRVEISRLNTSILIKKLIHNEEELKEEILRNYVFYDPDNDSIYKKIKFITKIPKFDLLRLDNKKIKLLVIADDAKHESILEDEIIIRIDESIKRLFSEETYEIFENEELELVYEIPENLLLKEVKSNVDVDVTLDNSTYKIKIKPSYDTVNPKIIIPGLRPSLKENIKLIFQSKDKTIIKNLNVKILDVNRLPILENQSLFVEDQKFYFIAYDKDVFDSNNLRSKILYLEGKCKLEYFKKIPHFCAGEYFATLEISDRLDKVQYNVSFRILPAEFKNIKIKGLAVKENESLSLELEKLLKYPQATFSVVDVVDENGISLRNYALSLDKKLLFKPFFDISNEDLNARIVFEFYNENLTWREFLPVKVLNVNRKPEFDLKVNRTIDKNNVKTLFVEIIAWDEDNDNLEIWSVVNGNKITGNKFKVVYSTKLPEIEIFVSDGKEITKRKVRVG